MCSQSVESERGRKSRMSNGIDLSFLVEASDDELRLPPSPVVQIDNQDVCVASSSNEEVFCPYSDFTENAEQKGFLDNWHFEDDFVEHAQFAASDDAAATVWDVVNLEAFVDGDYSASWDLETIC